MSDKKLELNRRRMLAGIGIIGAASAGAGAGTMALFSDNEQSQNNSIAAGELNLTLGDNASPTVDVSALTPGEGGKETLKVTNAGDVDGTLAVALMNVSKPSAGNNDIRTFTSDVTGFFDHNQDNVHRLDKYGVDPAVTQVDISGSDVNLNITLPVELGAASNGDNFALAFDANNSGTPDFQVTGGTSGELQYIPFTNSGWGSSKNIDDESGISGSMSGRSVALSIGTAKIAADSAFGFGGQVIYNGLESVNGTSVSSDTNDRVLLTPGFAWGPNWSSTTRYTTIDPTEVRTLDDVLDVEVRIDDDVDSPELDEDDDGSLVVQGKLSRISGEEGLGSEIIPAGESRYVEIIYRLPHNAGNAVAGQSVGFDLDLTLTQTV